jgi:hypothetical protein
VAETARRVFLGRPDADVQADVVGFVSQLLD